MKLDSFIQMIKDLRTNIVTDDESDTFNTILTEYASPFDQANLSDTVMTLKLNTSGFTWGNGSTYTYPIKDSNGNSYQAPSCGWLWGNGGKYS
jgi:hypothetical protein